MSEMQTIKAALERAVKTVTLKPQRGQRVYRNVATVSAGEACQAEEAGRTLTMDVGKAIGGNDAGPSPSMVLRSAMSGCVAIGIKQWAARREVGIEHVRVDLETDVDARGQLGVDGDAVPGFEGIRMCITVKSDAPIEVVEEIVAISLRYSPLMDVFLNPQSVAHQVSLIDPESAGGA